MCDIFDGAMHCVVILLLLLFRFIIVLLVCNV